MQLSKTAQIASTHVGGYLLMQYRDVGGMLHAANAVSALGAWAGIFAQIQAHALLITGAIPQSESSLVEVTTRDGERYFYGDAINACLFEGGGDAFLSFWNLAAGAAGDPDIASKVDTLEIAKHTSKALGGPEFGIPRVGPEYELSEMPIDAVRKHGPVLLGHFLELDLNPAELMVVFGMVAQQFAVFAVGGAADVAARRPMKRVDIVRLYMESAVPMSKLDTSTVGMATMYRQN